MRTAMPGWIARFAGSVCITGVLLGTLFFAASLTPSLLPRSYLMQGVLSGCSFAAGYLIGVLLRWLWRYLELPPPPRRLALPALVIASGICGLVAIVFLWKAAGWQNAIRSLMGMPPVETAHPLEVGVIAALVFILLLALARLLKLLVRSVSGRLGRRLPPRLAGVIGIVLVGWLLWAAASGVLFRYALRAIDSSFRGLDAVMEADIARPTGALKTGGPSSLLRWRGLGRMGRSFVASGPDAAQIAAFTGKPAQEPLRVYAGLNSAETVEERARLALEELKRVSAFERKVLVVITPTGTGWVDPAAIDTLEYLHGGDVASVGMQYSYLLSWLSLLIEPQYGAEAAQALFREVYRHWSELPRENRPRLYLHGLSLGALNSDLSLDLFDVVGDPPQGALWSGPPFPSRTWRTVTATRQPDTPAWLPRFRDGSTIRFYNQQGRAPGPAAPWGAMRIGYLQYASDPVTFFDPRAAYREPAWMRSPRGPDVSTALRWFPVVTQLQIGLDIALATTTPMGHGHVYAPEHHVVPWAEITEPEGWTEADSARLAAHLREQRLKMLQPELPR